MPTLNLKPTHKPIKNYYAALDQFDRLGVTHESAVRSAFQSLLQHCARQFNCTLVPEHSTTGRKNNRIIVDGALMDDFRLTHGYWEAKDEDDDLPSEVVRKFKRGYPRDNILFQEPYRAILWQNDRQTLDADLRDPPQLISTLERFFSYRPEEYTEWEEAVAHFKVVVPALGHELAKLIQTKRDTNRQFKIAFEEFYENCRLAINPNLSEAAVEEMLIQHLLTEQVFRTVFGNPDFTRRNVIAIEIEKVIDALTSQAFSRQDFLSPLNTFYAKIERTAATIDDFSQKQGFLNTVYEQFFQGFSVKVADTHGIVYTPQPIVDFMVRSVEEILKNEFNRSLSDTGVNIIDPFVGTGNFIVRIMREIRKTALALKYAKELHCIEVMLLPYYIASMNIEHEFYDATGMYRPYELICFADTFESVDDPEYHETSLFAEKNTRRFENQKETPMFVVIGNPPYNIGQVNEHDNNKNRKYPAIDSRIASTYVNDSKAMLKTALYDPYVKAISWASERIEQEGVVAFVTNNSFLDGVAFDGMRKHLAADFDAIYILDLGGNARKGLKVSDTNVFGIRVGISISFLIRRRYNSNSLAEIFYARVDEFWNKAEIFQHLNSIVHYRNIEWKPITPDHRNSWLTEGLHTEFESYISMGTKATKASKGESVDAIFKIYSGGVKTNRDAWVYNFNKKALAETMNGLIGTFAVEADRWKRRKNWDVTVDDFVIYDSTKIKWSSSLKKKLVGGQIAEFSNAKIRRSFYRPFVIANLYFDRMAIDRVLVFPSIFPTPETETNNRVICVAGVGDRKGFGCFITNGIPAFDLAFEKAQCFPFYTYDEDGSNRRENITAWALSQFREHYRDIDIGKWDIFHYVYGLLHHPEYRERYAANLKRDLPRLPYAPDFWGFAKAGKRLGEIHVGYENVGEYPLDPIETPDTQLDWRVEKMKLSKDKTQIKYNNFLTLDGIPAKAFNYRLGNRSALEWVIDQYRVKTDKRSGIVNDPNRGDDPQYIVKLIAKVITVSLETVDIVENLPDLGIQEFSRDIGG